MSKLASFDSICTRLRLGNTQHGNRFRRAQSERMFDSQKYLNKHRIFAANFARVCFCASGHRRACDFFGIFLIQRASNIQNSRARGNQNGLEIL